MLENFIISKPDGFAVKDYVKWIAKPKTRDSQWNEAQNNAYKHT